METFYLDPTAFKKFFDIILIVQVIEVLGKIIPRPIRPADISLLKDLYGIAQSIVTIVAIFVGAAWAIYNFVKSRVYWSRLEPKVAGRFITVNEIKTLELSSFNSQLIKSQNQQPLAFRAFEIINKPINPTYLLITLQLKNVGIAGAPIQQVGSGIRIYAHNIKDYIAEVDNVMWHHLATFPVFETHQHVESGEIIEEQRLITLPGSDRIFIKLVLSVISGEIGWETTSIIETGQ